MPVAVIHDGDAKPVGPFISINDIWHIPVTSRSGSVPDTPEFFEDTSFIAGDSPITLDLNAALSRNATEGYIINDGSGNFTVSFSTDGTAFGDAITMKTGEKLTFNDVSVDSLKITWVANSAYRVLVI